MPVNPRFLAARAAERRNRDIAHVRALAWVRLRRAGKPLATTPIVPLTMRHRLELRLAGNGFFASGRVYLSDVFGLLWRLHPLYRPLRLGCEEVQVGSGLLRSWIALGSLRSALARRRLAAVVMACDLPEAVAALDEFLLSTEQDAPAAPDGARRAPAAPERHDADNMLELLMNLYGLSHDAALDLPVAVANQLYRERMFSVPDGELEIFAPSDRLLSA